MIWSLASFILGVLVTIIALSIIAPGTSAHFLVRVGERKAQLWRWIKAKVSGLFHK